MLSLFLPRLASPPPISTPHRRHFLQPKALSISLSYTNPKPSLSVASFETPLLPRRSQLAAKAGSLEPEEEIEGEDGPEEEFEGEDGPEEEFEGEDWEADETGDLQVEEEEGDSEDKIYGFLEEEGEEAEEEYEEYDEDEEEEAIRACMVLKFVWMEKNIGVALEKVIQINFIVVNLNWLFCNCTEPI